MKYIFAAIVLLSGHVAYAQAIRVMSFNTMCSFCDSNDKDGPFHDRLKDFADIVERQSPDLISFQEFVWPSQVEKLGHMLHDQYTILYRRHRIFPTTDAVLMLRTSRFQVVKYDGVWLGPKLPKFSFGWKIGVPRRFVWADVIDLYTSREFIFAGTHFDNRHENKNPSAIWANSFFAKQTLPVIFAGDTNLETNSVGYTSLIGANMRNTFDEATSVVATANDRYQQVDFCTDVHDDAWPVCRIDHVLISKNAPWTVGVWGEDLFRYYQNTHFPSDHRAVIVELKDSSN